MTHDEIRAESFGRISKALNEVFPGIKTEADSNTLLFDDGAVKIEMTTCDAYDGYFEITDENSSPGALWGVKPVVSVLITEICKTRKQKVLSTLR